MTNFLKPFFAQKFLTQRKRYWDDFYRRNNTKFFKDRHWVECEFPELKQTNIVLFETGCGVGNFVLPMLRVNPTIIAYACDFSSNAVQLVQEQEGYDQTKMHVFEYDLTHEDHDAICMHIPVATVDVVTAFFVLSAMSPDQMRVALKTIYHTMKPGGLVLFRDYMVGDLAQERFERSEDAKKVAGISNLYVRQDGTLSYFFSQKMLVDLFTESGFDCVGVESVDRTTVNRKENLELKRLFIQARFRRPYDVTDGAADDR